MQESASTGQQAWERATTQIAAIRAELAKVVVGQDRIVEFMLVALLCRGHCLVVGVPGLAKTLLVSTLGNVLGLKFRRIQFTPDLMPADITGSEILQQQKGEGGRRVFEFAPGPIFANLVLADEINRAPPKTQSALLEAMQEKQVTAAGKVFPLDEPFLVFATQNPIEHEGTYPLPEAQLDRFFFQLNITYPARDEERDIVVRTTGRATPAAEQAIGATDVLALQDAVADVPLPEHVLDTILHIVRRSRPDSTEADKFVKQYVAWGAGPRASQNLTRAAKALAFLHGRPAASIEEVVDAAPAVLRHRIIPNYNAVGEGVSAADIIEHILGGIE
ncbi:MAG: MoxR family ATPase [Kiritimatiellaeota bacterium]|nr:MoxR family ATPase [Kiritimatiellota bacterium]